MAQWTPVWRPRGRLLALFIAMAAWVPRAHAGVDVAALEAEHVRLSEEIEQFADRSAWRGVDATYHKLEALERQGVTLTFEDHYAGAQAARSLGNVSDAYVRLKRAASLQATDEIKGWIAEIDATYGSVDLYVDPRFKDPSTLTPDEMPFDPSLRHVVELAQAQLESTRAYQGLLPHGGYAFGPEHFDVEQSESELTVELRGKGTKSKTGRTVVAEHDEDDVQGIAYAGPRLALGPAYSMASDASGNGLEPGAFSGPGVMAAGGFEAGWASRLGIFGELGYRGLWGSNGLTDTPRFPVGPDTMHLGVLWLGGSIRLGDLGIDVGPSLAMGTAQVAGVGGKCASAADPVCDNLASVDAQTLDYQRLVGFVRAVGGTAGAYYQFAYVGSLRSGIGIEGGALSDGARTYPWASVAMNLLPPPPRR